MRWNHVCSSDNPADCASRGMLAPELVVHRLWWHGPSWLSKLSALWPALCEIMSPQKNVLETVLSEARQHTTHHVNSSLEWDLQSAYSSWTRLIRITAYLKRLIRNLKAKAASREIDRSNLSLMSFETPRNFDSDSLSCRTSSRNRRRSTKKRFFLDQDRYAHFVLL